MSGTDDCMYCGLPSCDHVALRYALRPWMLHRAPATLERAAIAAALAVVAALIAGAAALSLARDTLEELDSYDGSSR